MLLLTANESKHHSVGTADDKKPAGPRNSFIIRSLSLPTPSPRPFFFFSLPVSSPLVATAIIANFRFGDATCQLPSRVVLSPRIRDVYLAGLALEFIAYANSVEWSIYRIILIADPYRHPRYRPYRE